MRPLVRRLFGACVLVMAFVMWAPFGCVENNMTLFVRHVGRPDPEDDCLVQADSEGEWYTLGSMDKGLRSTYWATMIVGNQLVPRGDPNAMRAESAAVQLYEVEVQVFDYTGDTLAEYTVPVSGFVGIGDSATPGYGFVGALLIDEYTSSLIDTTPGPNGEPRGQVVVARIKIYGVSLGGIEVESAYWDYPIYVCQSTTSGLCLGCRCPTTAEEEIVEACHLGQDDPYDCRLQPYIPLATVCPFMN